MIMTTKERLKNGGYRNLSKILKKNYQIIKLIFKL